MILEDKIVVVSGIGPGLGQELATRAALEGADVAVCARTAGKLDAVEKQIAGVAPGARVLKCPTDIQDREQCRRLARQTVDRFGRIDVLINSAYTAGAYAMADVADLDDWRTTMEINLFGTMTLIQEVVPYMKRGGGGSIVNVNTKVSRMPAPTMGGYAVSKAALRMATTQLAKELGGDGIRVNSVFPGWMWGETVEKGLAEQARDRGISPEAVRAEIAALIPIGDIPEDGECAKAVIALSSDYFSAATGACVDLCGGEYMPL